MLALTDAQLKTDLSILPLCSLTFDCTLFTLSTLPTLANRSHSVDGVLMLALTDAQLKTDLGILPLGHRRALLEAIRELKEGTKHLEAGAAKVKKVCGGWI